MVCPPPSPSFSAQRTSRTWLAQNEADAPAVVPMQTAISQDDAESAAGCPEHTNEYSRVSDAYYDRLMASWAV